MRRLAKSTKFLLPWAAQALGMVMSLPTAASGDSCDNLRSTRSSPSSYRQSDATSSDAVAAAVAAAALIAAQTMTRVMVFSLVILAHRTQQLKNALLSYFTFGESVPHLAEQHRGNCWCKSAKAFGNRGPKSGLTSGPASSRPPRAGVAEAPLAEGRRPRRRRRRRRRTKPPSPPPSPPPPCTVLSTPRAAPGNVDQLTGKQLVCVQ